MKILVAVFLALVSQEPQIKESSIEGMVTRYGVNTPIANVEISLIPFGLTNDLKPEVITDANGHFILGGVLPGKYTLRARRGGYVNPAPGGIPIGDGGSAKTVTVGAGQHLDNVRLTLVPGAVVAGRVLDSAGRPAIGVSVSALPLAPGGKNFAKSTETDDRGEYRIFDLETGRYIVTAGRDSRDDYSVFSSQPALAKMYFPGKIGKAEAVPLDLAGGIVLNDIDFTLLSAEQAAQGATFTVSGKLTSDSASLTGFYFDLYLVQRPPKQANTSVSYDSKRGWFPGWFATFKSNKRGNDKAGDASSFAFEFDDVRPGSYTLFIVKGNSSDDYDCCDVVGRAPLDVSGDVNGITVVAGGVDVHGEVVVKGSNGKPPVSFDMALVPEDIHTRHVKPSASGAFTIPSVLPGVWELLIEGIPPELVLFDIRQDDKSVTDSGVIVGDRKAEPVQVILSSTGSIAGIVNGADGQAVPAAEVLLIPAGSNESNSNLYLRTTSDGVGRFTLPAIAVGEYRIVALEPPARDDRGSVPTDPPTGAKLRTIAASYKTQGVPLTVRSGAASADLTLHPIPRTAAETEKSDPVPAEK